MKVGGVMERERGREQERKAYKTVVTATVYLA